MFSMYDQIISRRLLQEPLQGSNNEVPYYLGLRVSTPVAPLQKDKKKDRLPLR